MPNPPRCSYRGEIIDPEIQDQLCSCECEMLYLGEMIMEEFTRLFDVLEQS